MQTNTFQMCTIGTIYSHRTSNVDAPMNAHKHNHAKCVHRELSIKGVSQWDKNVIERGEEGSCERVKRAETVTELLWYLAQFRHSAVWTENLPTSRSTVWQSERHTESERGSVKERERRSHTFQSQRVGQTLQTIKTWWPPPQTL